MFFENICFVFSKRNLIIANDETINDINKFAIHQHIHFGNIYAPQPNEQKNKNVCKCVTCMVCLFKILNLNVNFKKIFFQYVVLSNPIIKW